MRKSLLIAAMFAAAPLYAGGAGTTGAPFLKVPMNARAVGMAGAFTAVEGDVTALEYNPAGLVNLRRADIALTYIDYLQSTSLQSFALGLPVGTAPEAEPNGAFSPRKAVAGFQFRQFLASDDARNDVGVKTGTLDIRDQLFHAGFAFAVTPMLSIGASAKYISEKLGDDSIGTFAGDAGVLWLGPEKIKIGASLLNAGPSKAFETVKDPLPTLVRVGASRPFGPLLVVADVSEGRDKVTRVAGGAEWGLGRYVKIRGGAFEQTSNVGFTAGLGVLVPGPMKSIPSAQRRGSVPPIPTRAPANELVFNEHRAADLLDRLNVLATDLIERFHRAGLRPADYRAAVLPASGAGDRMGAALADLVGQQLQQEFPIVEGAKVEPAYKEFGAPANIDDDQAARLGDMLKARAVVIQQLTNSRDGYVLSARIVSVDTGNAVAAASTTLPADAFRGGRHETLASVPDRPADRYRANDNRVDWGLEYGFTSQDILGVTHTITLRILY